nr:hypothetical protein Iba_scaffold1011.2CG0140 [Ipomoea batatas]
MKKVPAPCNVAKNIIAVPSQVWYLTETSNWRPSNRNTAILLNTGRRRRAKQASVSKPNRVATLNILYCHLFPEIISNASVESPCQKDDEQRHTKDFNPRQDP